MIPLFSKKSLRILMLVLCASLLALPLQACTSSSNQEPDQVKVVVLPYTSFGPLFIAQEEGFFTDENLAVEFIRFDDGSKAFPSLVQGDVDASGSAPTIAFFNALGDGSVVRFVADRGNLASDGCNYMSLLASPSWIEKYNISPVDALTDVKVNIDPTNFEAFMFEKVLNQSGLTLDDTQSVDLAPPSLAEAVQNGAVEVVSIGDPWLTRLLDTGVVTVWKLYQEIVPDMQFGGLLYGPGMLDRPEVGVRFMKAYLRGVRQYNEGKTERNLEIMAQYTGVDVELLQRACWPPMQNDGMISTNTVDEFQNWAFSKGLIRQVIPVETYWDPSFIDQATP